MKQRILVVADDAALRASLARWLIAAGYAVELAEGAKRAREVEDRVALAILAVDRVGDAGIDLAHDLAKSIDRLLIVAERADELDKWIGSPLATGGCLRLPFDEEALLARVKAALPAAASSEEDGSDELLHFAGITLDVAGRTCVGPDGQSISLTQAEFSLLAALARRPGRVQSRNELQRAMTGRDAEPDDRTVDVLVSRLRRKIEKDPKEPRRIITVPGEGYKLSAPAAVADDADPAPRPAAAAEPEPGTMASPPSPTSAHASVAAPRRRTIPWPASSWTAAAVALIAALVVLLWHLGFAARSGFAPAVARQKFDAAVVPLVTDVDREALASYPAHPDAKAVAISNDGWGMAFGSADIESAKREALERCSNRAQRAKACRIYAIGMDVVWQAASVPMPLPVDFRDESLDAPLVADDVPAIVANDENRRKLAELLVIRGNHKALAVTKDAYWLASNYATRALAIRLAVERCGDLYQVPCLLISVDGQLTVRIPKSRRVVDLFMLTTEAAMSEADRRRIAQTYRQKSWRALARGRSGGWYAVANAASEEAAAEGALAACARSDGDCRIYAIENFRVAEQQAHGPDAH